MRGILNAGDNRANAYVICTVGEDGNPSEQREHLNYCTSEFPERPFGWIKSLEQAILQRDQGWFHSIREALPTSLDLDHRCHVLLAIGHGEFGAQELAVSHAQRAAELAIHDPIPIRVAARFLVEFGRTEEAAILLKLDRGSDLDPRGVESAVAQFPEIGLPLYYNY